MQLQNTVDAFLTNFRSAHTKSAYQNDLQQFIDFCADQLRVSVTHPTHITEQMCVLWKHHAQNFHNSTQARKISALSSFLKFCQRKKIITANPLEFLPKPKISDTVKTNILTQDEWSAVFECAQKNMAHFYSRCNDTQYKLWKKRYVILYTLFTVGMRVEELCQLKYEDLEKIDNNVYRLHLTVKGNQKHAPLIHKNTALNLIDFMQTFGVTEKGQSLFQNIHRTSVYHIVKLCVKKAGIHKRISPHSLRASLATHLHQIGVPIGHIKDLLNHKNIATTLLYTRVSEEELKENAELLA